MYRALISHLVIIGFVACRPARPLMVENKEGSYYFQDRQTGRIVGGPYRSTYENPEAGSPKSLPRKQLIEALDSTRRGLPWLVNAWGQRTVRAFYFDNGPDYVQEGLMRYTNDSSLVGFANSKGQIKIPARFTIAYPFNHGYSIVGQGSHLEPLFPGETEHMAWRGGKWGIIDRRGNTLVPVQYDALNPVRENDRWLEAVRGSEKFLITHTGRRLSPRAYSTYNYLPDTTGARRPWRVDDLKGW